MDSTSPEHLASGKWIHPRDVKIYKEAGRNVFPVEVAFRLHDTCGFPIDLTRVMARERGMTVDETGYESMMDDARRRSRHGTSAVESVDLEGDVEQAKRLAAAIIDCGSRSPQSSTRPPASRTCCTVWKNSS